MSELELGKATIAYEGPDDETVEETVDNEQLVYVRDHWAIRSGTDDEGNDLMKQIPTTRVYHVERNVEKFKEETRTVRHRVESIANELGRKLPMDVGDGRKRRRTPSEPTKVPVEGPEGEGQDETEYGP